MATSKRSPSARGTSCSTRPDIFRAACARQRPPRRAPDTCSCLRCRSTPISRIRTKWLAPSIPSRRPMWTSHWLRTARSRSLAKRRYRRTRWSCERASSKGPHDYDARLRWWLQRMARGGKVIAPGDPNAPVQFVDVRDLGAWTAKSARLAGTFNVTGPAEPITMRALLGRHARGRGQRCRADVGSGRSARLEVGGRRTPSFPSGSPLRSARSRCLSHARSRTGLVHRPWMETLRDAWAWTQTGWDAEASGARQPHVARPRGPHARTASARFSARRRARRDDAVASPRLCFVERSVGPSEPFVGRQVDAPNRAPRRRRSW